MAEPTNPTGPFMKTSVGKKMVEAIRKDICSMCGKPATEFTDELSRREYAISGACQTCQDEIFKEEEDEF